MKSDEAKRKKLYVERDISWMYFNQRILLEAARPEVPLLEQLTFLGIYSNNLDEFFRVRVATLNRIVEYDDKNIREERDTAARTLKQIGKLHNQFDHGEVKARKHPRHQRYRTDTGTGTLHHFTLPEPAEWVYQSALSY